MSKNKQTTIIELFLNEIGQYIDTSEITDSVIEKYILMERANIELIELEAKEIVIIRQCAEEATKNASAYSDGYKEGYKRACDYMTDTIKNKIEIKQNGSNTFSTSGLCPVFVPNEFVFQHRCKNCGNERHQHPIISNTI
jgi:hypothetical protein